LPVELLTTTTSPPVMGPLDGWVTTTTAVAVCSTMVAGTEPSVTSVMSVPFPSAVPLMVTSVPPVVLETTGVTEIIAGAKWKDVSC